jgi:N-acetylglucosaminyl-diphospho-decaprenol L-rhamnosyltransferase
MALITSLASQVSGLSGAIVVVDDASPEPMPDVDGATVVRREINGGFGAAVNTGLALVTTDLVAVLNSDLVVEDGFLEELVDAALPWLPAIVAPQVVTHGHTGATSFRFPGPGTVLAQGINLVAARRDSGWASRLIGEDKPAHPDDTHLVDWVSGAAFLAPTETLRSVGGFDERFHMYNEEVDLQRRLRERGIPAVYVGSVRVEHIGFGSSDPSKRERWQLESWQRYADKWGWEGRLKAAVATASAINLVTDGLRRTLGRDVHPYAEWQRRRTLAREVWSDQARRAS